MRILVILIMVWAIAANAESLPKRRPALFGSGPKSLVNLIDPNELMTNGQGDAWVMFDFMPGQTAVRGR